MASKLKCKHCTKYFPKEEKIVVWWINVCSKWCSRSYLAAKKKKVQEKEKVKNQKKRAKKADTITVLKKKLWTIVSEYIRLRDSNDDNYCKCATCDNFKHYKDSMQAGHYIASWQSSFHRYNEKNIHPQCYWCNVWKHWNVLEYQKFMIIKYWKEYTDYLYDTRNELADVWKEAIKELTVQYKKKLEEIKMNKIL